MKVFFFTPYPNGQSPSQRFRFEQYLLLLKENYALRQWSFLPLGRWRAFYSQGLLLQKCGLLIGGFASRLVQLFQLRRETHIFIHREITPIGPPIFEWIIAIIMRKKIIYDFDDAIWLTDKINESKIESILRWRSKVSAICAWSYKVSCGNEYLASYARQFNTNVIVNPTTIETENLHNPTLYDKAYLKTQNQITGPVIGWTGSHSTLKYLEVLYPVFLQLQHLHPQVTLLVIADRPPNLELKNLIFKKWTKETEVADLMLADIGIMPLPCDEWTRGKCGFKALQYLALQIPCVASPVGINRTIVKDNETGFLANSDEQWLSCLDRLIKSEALQKEMGLAGRQFVEKHYSVKANTTNFLSLFT